MKHYVTSLFLLVFLIANMAVAQDSWNIEFLGCMPGHLEDVQIEGNYAYGAARSGLLILDITNIGMPTQVTFLPLPGAFNIALEGRYAYITAGHYTVGAAGGLYVVDISVPESPILVGSCSTPERPVDLLVNGDYAYVADSWNGIRIIDISTPTEPVEIGFLATESPLRGLDLVGGILYLADQYNGLRLIDVTNPSAPEEIGLFDPSSYVNGVIVQGIYAFIACFPGLRVVDISVPSAPVEASSYDTSQGVRYLSITGSYAYLSHYDAMSVLDISLPTLPSEVGFLSIYGRTGHVTVRDNIAYIAGGFGGLRIVDISDPSTMTEIGFYGLLGDVSSVQIEHNRIFLTGGYYYSGESCADKIVNQKKADPFWAYSGLFALDLSDPTVPTLLSYSAFGNAIDVCVIKNITYVTDYLGMFGIFDLSDPTTPVLVGSAYTSYRSTAEDVQGDYAFIVNEETDLRILDISNPSFPTEVGNIALGSNDVEVQGDYAYITHYYSGLHIVDFSQPSAPYEVGNYDTPNWANGLAVAGDLAFIANGILGLRIIDVSEPNMPTEISVYDTPGIAENVVVDDGHAYVADGEGGVRVIDISTPDSPVEVGYYVTSFSTLNVAVAGDYIAVGTGDGGLFVLANKIITDTADDGFTPANSNKSRLEQNFPNPFNPSTDIHFRIPHESRVRLAVYTVGGRCIATLVDTELTLGDYEYTWSGCDEQNRAMPSGVYFYRLEAGEFVETNRMTLIR